MSFVHTHVNRPERKATANFHSQEREGEGEGVWQCKLSAYFWPANSESPGFFSLSGSLFLGSFTRVLSDKDSQWITGSDRFNVWTLKFEVISWFEFVWWKAFDPVTLNGTLRWHPKRFQTVKSSQYSLKVSDSETHTENVANSIKCIEWHPNVHSKCCH